MKREEAGLDAVRVRHTWVARRSATRCRACGTKWSPENTDAECLGRGRKAEQIARPALPPRGYNHAPLQQLRIDVARTGGWFVICQELEEQSGARVWKIQTIHPNLSWHGESLPFTSPADAPAPNVFTGCGTARTAEERDAEVERLRAALLRPWSS